MGQAQALAPEACSNNPSATAAAQWCPRSSDVVQQCPQGQGDYDPQTNEPRHHPSWEQVCSGNEVGPLCLLQPNRCVL